MSTDPGKFTLGPDNATLTIRTGKGGAAAKAAHNLVIEVTAWEATLTLGAAPAITLTADSRSLHVREASGGMGGLGDDEKASIRQTIDEDVLKGTAIAFRSTSVTAGDAGRLAVEGELELSGKRHPIAFDLHVGGDGKLTGSAVVKQTDWGMKPYSTLFGTLKVSDEVEVVVDAALPAS